MLGNFSLESILENMTMGVVLIDSDENLIYMNQLVTEITGYEIEDVNTLAKCFRVVFPDLEKRQEFENIFDEKLNNYGYYNAVFPIRTKEGKVKHLEFRVNLLEDNYLLVNMINVSDKIAQDRELKETKERLEMAVEAADIGIWDWNIKTGEFLYSE
ncbi:MAG: PAS domain S-box protein, partial [Bacillota bacterium]